MLTYRILSFVPIFLIIIFFISCGFVEGRKSGIIWLTSIWSEFNTCRICLLLITIICLHFHMHMQLLLAEHAMLLAFQSRRRLGCETIYTLNRIDVPRWLDFSMRLYVIDIPNTRWLYSCKGATTFYLLMIADQVGGLSRLLDVLLLVGISWNSSHWALCSCKMTKALCLWDFIRIWSCLWPLLTMIIQLPSKRARSIL